jgi:hypothetical protein
MNFYNNGAVIRTQLEKAAKCSLPLIKALSDERIYKVLILFTFFDNDERLPVDESYFKPASYEYLTRSQRICLQMDILECPWCAYAPLKKPTDVITYLAITKEWRLRGRMQPTKPSTDRSPPPAINDSKV